MTHWGQQMSDGQPAAISCGLTSVWIAATRGDLALMPWPMCHNINKLQTQTMFFSILFPHFFSKFHLPISYVYIVYITSIVINLHGFKWKTFANIKFNINLSCL